MLTSLARRLTVPAVAAALVGATTIAPAASAAAPFGDPVLLYHQQVDPDVAVATSSRAVTVAVWRARQSDGRFVATAATQSAGHAWSPPFALSAAGVNAVEPHAVAWGDGKVSVVWEIPAGRDNWTFQQRTLGANGRWGPVQTLQTVEYAFDEFGVDINDSGAMVLAWERGDHHVAVALRSAGGGWTRPAPVPVTSPGTTFQYIGNPRAVFITAAGKVSVVPWGVGPGGGDPAIWLADLTGAGAWRTTRIGPTGDGRSTYGIVDGARFAANADGAFAGVFTQQDPQSKQWTTLYAYRRAGGAVSTPQPLGHYPCNVLGDYPPATCADVAVDDAGRATVAWAQTASEVDVFVARGNARGALGAKQRVYDIAWDNSFSGVDVEGNPGGDATVVFAAGNHQVFNQEFVRCPAGSTCVAAASRQNKPSWLDYPRFALAPDGTTTMAWTSGCSGGESCRPNNVFALSLASA